MVGGVKQAELDYRDGLVAQCTKPCSLPRESGGMPPGKFLKIRYFEIESGGTFLQNIYSNVYLP